MRVRFFGVRGSLPVPGPRTERYGGNTSCVEVVTDGGTRIVIDAGTGIRRLGKELTASETESEGTETHILVSHTHWDHIQGLPFFAPLYRPGSKLVVYAGHRNSDHLRSILNSQPSPELGQPDRAGRRTVRRRRPRRVRHRHTVARPRRVPRQQRPHLRDHVVGGRTTVRE